jgi:hypothetical protein
MQRLMCAKGYDLGFIRKQTGLTPCLQCVPFFLIGQVCGISASNFVTSRDIYRDIYHI